ncbi:MAG: sugar ABC transporter ATP-binding protein [Thermotogota bacterium]
MDNIILETKGISKEFSGVRVLNDISIGIKKGEIFGIIGENGAGKSTLMKILSGIYHPTEGEIYFNGQKVDIKNRIISKELGITMIPQEFNLINTLNVYENIFLGNEYKKSILLDKNHMKQKTNKLLEDLNTKISPESKIQDLSVAQKQMVEIAKAMAYDSKILIMDEPTTVLTRNEIDILYDLMKSLKERGVSILFISHKLNEVKKICDRVMVLRDGDMIGISENKDIDEEEMAKKMVGRELSEIFPEKSDVDGDVKLKIVDLFLDDILKNINFYLKKGEILGFSGLVGSGRTELMETIFGIRKKTSGKIFKDNEEITIKNPSDAFKNKIAYLSEDRQDKGLIMNFDIPQNISLISLKKYSKILINKRKEKKKSEEYIKEFEIRAASLKNLLIKLSGGNQQKVYLSKLMDTDPEILILDEPTRGIDVNAKREFYKFIKQLSEKGISVIIVSSELEELIGMCNRVYVMKEGEIKGAVEEEKITEENIMFYATGIKERRETNG